MNLLIVNDEILVAESMKEDIEWHKRGIDAVYIAGSAQQAKERIESTCIQIMLCDIEMPEESGISLLRWIRDNQYDIECIFLTCHADFRYAQEAINLGCNKYMLIPARYEEIGAEVAKCAEGWNNRRHHKLMQEYGEVMWNEKIEHISEDGSSTAQLIHAATTYILKHFPDTELSVNQLAKKLHVHPVYLNRIFKREKNTSVSQFIIQTRMQMAIELLEQKNMSISKIAKEVGYSSYSNFRLAFKKYFSRSPSQYRK